MCSVSCRWTRLLHIICIHCEEQAITAFIADQIWCSRHKDEVVAHLIHPSLSSHYNYVKIIPTRGTPGFPPSSVHPLPHIMQRISPLQRTSSPTHYAEVGTPQDFPPPAYILSHTLCRGFPPSSVHPLPHIMQR